MSQQTAKDPILPFLCNLLMEVRDNLAPACYQTFQLVFCQQVGQKSIHPTFSQLPHPVVEPAIQFAGQQVLGVH